MFENLKCVLDVGGVLFDDVVDFIMFYIDMCDLLLFM